MNTRVCYCIYNSLKRNVVLLIFLMSLVLVENVGAASINASSCSQVEVQSAILEASTGDTVFVPAGKCDWSTGITIPDNKKITLQGAGKNATLITMFSFGTVVDLGKSGSRLTGFEFTNGKVATQGYGFIIDNCKIEKTGTWGDVIKIWSLNTNNPDVPYGLIHSCEIINGRIVSSGTNMASGDGDGTAQHKLWIADYTLGGSDSVYVEDCTFTNGHSIDGNYGGRYVFRFNEITGGLGLETHAARGTQRGHRAWEIYKNELTKGLSWMAMFIRAGTGVIFDNTFNGSIEFGLDIRRLILTESNRCTGSNGWDGNTGTGNEVGYACRDQIGRGSDSVLWYHDPPEPYAQPLTPAYFWLNRSSGSIKNVSRVNDSGYHIQPDRDFYDEVESFDGTSGIGYGTLGNRPTTCTTGVAYWATDQGNWNKSGAGGQGVLYKCTSKNNWELYYTPYDYPHPLRNQSGDGTLNPPKSLWVVQ